MKNISFDNPLWLLLLIPLALGIIIPFAIAIRRDNRSKSVVASLIIHMVIVLLVGLSVAGTVITTVMTETHVYVVADVSYSANKSLDSVDGYINSVKESLPRNSKLGVVCFGKNHLLHTEMGAELTSVKDAVGTDKIDDSATDIASALEYTASLFEDGVIKKVVLITDGRETVNEDVSEMIAAVEQMNAQDISIDAIYLDSNIKEDSREIQITGVEYTKSTYLNHETTADILIQSSSDTRATLSLYQNGKKYTDLSVQLTKGYNVHSFKLPTGAAGSFGYEVRISPVSQDDDTSDFNNIYLFSQRVSSDINVLLVTSNEDDIGAAEKMFGSNANIDVMYISTSSAPVTDLKRVTERYASSETLHINQNPKNVPCSVTALCEYDEIVLSNVDIRMLNNVSAFVKGVEHVVSQYGKSLVTIGDTKIQNKTDETLESLENMLPVKFGNSAQDSKLYAIVVDTSRSMFSASKLAFAKQAAIHMLNLLADDDDVIVVSFAGDISIIQPITKAAKRNEIAKKINDIKPQQGTSIGGGLKAAIEKMVGLEHDVKQVMLISDGLNYTAEIVEIDGKEMSVTQVAQYIAANDVQLSTMNIYTKEGESLLKRVASSGGGNYYYVTPDEDDLDDLIFSDVADDVTDVFGKESPVYVTRQNDSIMHGVPQLKSVKGYVHSKAKLSAFTVLKVDYTKASGTVVQVPLYSYWKYGNGRVASFTGGISGEWAENWQSGAGQIFLSNMADVNIPEEKIDKPYALNVNYDGIYANVEIIPAVLNPYATAEVTVTAPDGTVTTEKLIFDSTRYFYRFEASELGRYGIEVFYKSDGFVGEETLNLNESSVDKSLNKNSDCLQGDYEIFDRNGKLMYRLTFSGKKLFITDENGTRLSGEYEYTVPQGSGPIVVKKDKKAVTDFELTAIKYSNTLLRYTTIGFRTLEMSSEDSVFNISYSPEYDAFANFDSSTLHAAIRHRGTVAEGAVPDISGNEENVATYRLTFAVPFMITAVVLYVIDIIIRKLKWGDIKTFFKRNSAK